jgi:hypothetical protein
MAKGSSHPLLSHADGIATGMTDILLLNRPACSLHACF